MQKILNGQGQSVRQTDVQTDEHTDRQEIKDLNRRTYRCSDRQNNSLTV